MCTAINNFVPVFYVTTFPKFKFEACEESKPENTGVFEDLDFEQQRRSWTLETNTI